MNNFHISLPVEVIKSEDGNYKIRGLASTSSVDRQGEILDPAGFDMSHIEAGKGLLNFDHKNDPANIVGHITGYSKNKNGLIIEGELFKGHKTAEDIYAVMNGLNKAGKSRWGLSVEGSVLERDAKNPKKIKKAKIKNVAITLNPVNPDTCVDLVKSCGYETEEELIKSLVDSDFLEFDTSGKEAPQTFPTLFTAQQVMELLHKALSVGGEYATETPSQFTGGAALAQEDLKTKKKEEKKAKKKLKQGDSEFYKSLTGEVMEKLKNLYPDTDTSTLWEIVRDRINYKLLDEK